MPVHDFDNLTEISFISYDDTKEIPIQFLGVPNQIATCMLDLLKLYFRNFFGLRIQYMHSVLSQVYLLKRSPR